MVGGTVGRAVPTGTIESVAASGRQKMFDRKCIEL